MSRRPAAAAAITAGSPPPAKGSTSAFFSARRFPPRACRFCRWPRAWPPPRPSAPSPGSTVDLRWPNDLLIGPRKAGGILVEAQPTPKGCPTQCVGIGINVHQRAFPPDLATPATSLDLETGRRISRQALLVALLKSLQREALRVGRSGGGRNHPRARRTGFHLDARPQRRSAWPASLHRRHGRPRRERIPARRNRGRARHRANRRPRRGERLAASC